MPDYTRIGALDDFAQGVMQPVEAGGRSIAVLRLEDRFYAFDNFCTHEGVTFTSGYGVVAKKRVICMLHSSAFEVATGEVLAGPAPDPLQTYEVLVQNFDVLVALPG
jgi:3-phenylpropionate/trans-cinnamate dioxygenase ferredoxin subunit